MPSSGINLAVVCNDSQMRKSAVKLAETIGASLLFNVMPCDLSSSDFVLLFNQNTLFLQQAGRQASGPVFVDFLSGSVNHRRQFGGGRGQIIAKAVGLQAHVCPNVLDATAGLGRDAFVLASLGCKVHMLERSPVAFALLDNGLRRANMSAADVELREILSRLSLQKENAHCYLKNFSDQERPHVIYLDPMFPERKKSANVKKEMRVFHALVGKDTDADDLLESALALAEYRVVVKRPKQAAYLAGKKPSMEFAGKSGRFDVYTNKKMPVQLP